MRPSAAPAMRLFCLFVGFQLRRLRLSASLVGLAARLRRRSAGTNDDWFKCIRRLRIRTARCAYGRVREPTANLISTRMRASVQLLATATAIGRVSWRQVQLPRRGRITSSACSRPSNRRAGGKDRRAAAEGPPPVELQRLQKPALLRSRCASPPSSCHRRHVAALLAGGVARLASGTSPALLRRERLDRRRSPRRRPRSRPSSAWRSASAPSPARDSAVGGGARPPPRAPRPPVQPPAATANRGPVVLRRDPESASAPSAATRARERRRLRLDLAAVLPPSPRNAPGLVQSALRRGDAARLIARPVTSTAPRRSPRRTCDQGAFGDNGRRRRRTPASQPALSRPAPLVGPAATAARRAERRLKRRASRPWASSAAPPTRRRLHRADGGPSRRGSARRGRRRSTGPPRCGGTLSCVVEAAHRDGALADAAVVASHFVASVCALFAAPPP